MADEIAELMGSLSLAEEEGPQSLSRSSSSTSVSQGISTAFVSSDGTVDERGPSRRAKPSRSSLQINRMIPSLRKSPSIQSVALEAAARAPRRKTGRRKGPASRLLSQALLSWEDLPDYLRDNEYIHGHYRPPHMPLRRILGSVFSIHNETLNIWTHLLGCFAMAFLASSVTGDAASSQSLGLSHWPMYIYLIGAASCFLISSVCHIFGCCRPHVTRVMWRFDYVGISLLIMAANVPLLYYGFYCQAWSWRLHMGTVTFLGLSAICVSLMDKFQTTRFRHMRAGIFFLFSCFGLVPLTHLWLIAAGSPLYNEAMTWYIVMGLMGLMSALIFTSRVPERWLPGKFDLALNSHNIFHVSTMVTACIYYVTALKFLEWREIEGCPVIP